MKWTIGCLRYCLVSTHKDLGIILIQGPLIVTNSWHILDDHRVVGMLAFLVKHSISLDHIVNDVGLGDFLGAELPLGTEVFSIIISQMVITCNGSELDASTNEKIDQSGLHLGLSRLEIITANE